MSSSMLDRGLWRPDEPRVAGICAEMARTGEYVVPRLNGTPFLEYPPLYYVAGAALGSLLGRTSDVPYRLCSILFGFLTLGIIFMLMHQSHGIEGGILAAGILASSWGFFRVWHWIIVDISLVCSVALSMYAYIRVNDLGRVRYSALFGLGIGLSFLSKGLVGPAIISSAVLMETIRLKGISSLRRTRPLLVLACALAPVLPWMISLYQHGGWPFLREMIVVNNFLRFTGAPEGAALGHQEGLLFYWNAILHQMLPWTLLFIPALVMSLRTYRENPFLSWFIGPLVLLSLSATKRGVYLAPLCPAAACMTAAWLKAASRGKWEELMLRLTWAFAILGSLAPFAGLALGYPAIGSAMGLMALGAMVFFTWCHRFSSMREISLVFVMCIALSACTAVYAAYRKPVADDLAFAREASLKANGRLMTIIGSNESTRGVFSLAAGRVLPVIDRPADLERSGLYVWDDRDDRKLNALQAMGKVQILMKSTVGNREMYMAIVRTNPVG